MAIEYYSSIDLNQNEILRPVIHNSGTINDNSGILGQLYVHNTQNKLYFHDGTNFIDLTAQGDVTAVLGGAGLTATNSGGPQPSLAVNVDDTTIEINSDTLRIKAGGIDIAKLAVSGITISDGSQTDVVNLGETATITGSQGVSFAIDSSNTFVVSGTLATTSAAGVAKFNSSDFAVSGAGDVTIKSGGVSNTQLAGSITNSKLVNSAITIGGTSTALGGTITALTALTDLDLTSGNKTIFDGVGANTLTMGASGTTITIPGNLVVSGTQTVQNETVQIVENNTILFEGTTDDTNEIKLTGGDPTGDRVVTLPDASGTIALTSQITGTNSGTNTGDQLVFKTVSTDSGSAVADTTTDTLTISGGNGIDTSASGDTITVTAETATSSNAGVVELASATEAKNGSGTDKVIDASQLGARSVISTISASSIQSSTNKRATITHSLGTKDITIEMYDTSTNATVYAEVTRTSNGSTADDDKITVDFGVDITNDIKVVITSNKGGTGVTPTYA